jgi:hypothetical protein
MVDRGTVLAFCVTSPCARPQDGLQWEHCDIVGGHRYETHGSVSAFGKLLGVKGFRHLMSGFRDDVIIIFSFGTGNAVAVTI